MVERKRKRDEEIDEEEALTEERVLKKEKVAYVGLALVGVGGDWRERTFTS